VSRSYIFINIIFVGFRLAHNDISLTSIFFNKSGKTENIIPVNLLTAFFSEIITEYDLKSTPSIFVCPSFVS